MLRPRPFHCYLPRRNDLAPLLVTLHADGDDERGAIDLGGRLWRGAPIISVRGSVRSGAGWRFFDKAAGEVLSPTAAFTEIEPVAAVVVEVAQRHEMPPVEIVLVGFGGGADAAAALLRARPAAYAAALLYEPERVWAVEPYPAQTTAGCEVLVACGPAKLAMAESTRSLLTSAGAEVAVKAVSAGVLSERAEDTGRLWLRQRLLGDIVFGQS